MHSCGAHLIKIINKPAAFIIAETQPVAIQCCCKFFNFFGIVFYYKNNAALFGAVHPIFKTNGCNDWRQGINHELKITKLPETRFIPTGLFTICYRFGFGKIISAICKTVHNHFVGQRSCSFNSNWKIAL